VGQIRIFHSGQVLVKWYRQIHPSASVIDLTVQDCEEFIPSSLNF
jgi:hypothetical protein